MTLIKSFILFQKDLSTTLMNGPDRLLFIVLFVNTEKNRQNESYFF